MKLVKIKKTGEIFPLQWSTEIKNDTLKYFVRGEGYKKTKAFKVLEDEVPDKWTKMSWLQIAKYADQYGLNLGEVYADCKVAGIVARQTALGKMKMYQAIKDIIPENFNEEFFDLLPCDYMLSCFGMITFDICQLDVTFGKIDHEYDNVNATYKGKTCSMNEYVTQKYGPEYSKLIDALIEMKIC